MQKSVLGRLRAKLGSGFSTDDHEQVADNLLKLSVFYDQLQQKNIDETPAYTVIFTARAMLSAVLGVVILSVRPSVFLSVTRVHCD